MKKLIALFLVMVLAIVVCVPISAAEIPVQEIINDNGNIVFKDSQLPSWLPDDAPQPHPNSEITTIYWYIDEDENVVTYDPRLRTSVEGSRGTVSIYWTLTGQVYWGVTSKISGPMVFRGNITVTNGSSILSSSAIGDVSFEGSCDGLVSVNTKKGQNIATLTGIMIDLQGISFSLPGASSSLTISSI